METIITGLFRDRLEAESAIKELMDAGVTQDEVSYLYLDEDEVEVSTGSDVPDVGAGTASGAATGAAVGALAGLAAATGVLTGLGSVFVAGPLAAALGLTGAAATTVSGAVTGAAAGGLIGALTSLGVAREDAEIYDERVRAGGVLVLVEVGNAVESEAAKEILRNQGADEVRSYSS